MSIISKHAEERLKERFPKYAPYMDIIVTILPEIKHFPDIYSKEINELRKRIYQYQDKVTILKKDIKLKNKKIKYLTMPLIDRIFKWRKKINIFEDNNGK